MCEYIKGKEISESIQEGLKKEFEKMRNKLGRAIKLGVFLVGEDKIIDSFVKIKKRVAENIGVDFYILKYSDNISEEYFIKELLDKQKIFDGVIVQLPLPENFNLDNVLKNIDKDKDVDLLNKKNIEQFKKNNIEIMPPVAGAVKKIIELKSSFKNFLDKKVLIVGLGKLTGEPVKDLFENIGFELNKNLFVVDINTSEDEFYSKIKEADLIISGTGVPNLIKEEMIKKDVFLIDMGTSSLNKKIVGDISLDSCAKSVFFAKTPGGVGPLTVVTLYENLLKLVRKKYNF